jgi:hypothetical protein
MTVDYLLNATRPTPSLAALAQRAAGRAKRERNARLMRLYELMTVQIECGTA